MAEETVATNDAVKTGQRGVVVALLLVVLVFALLAAAYVFLGGADLVSSLLGGGAANTANTPVKPAKPSSTATSTASTAPSPSADPSSTVTAEQAAQMYWEQVASQEQISDLVSGEITAMSFGAVTNSGTTANVRVGVSHKSGSTVSGTMVLRDYSGTWYFSSIARDGNSLAVPTGDSPDPGIVSTIVAQQAANQAIVKGIIDGTYKTATVTDVSSGSGTVTVNLQLDGGTVAKTAGSVVIASKVVNGEKLWFITSFTKN